MVGGRDNLYTETWRDLQTSNVNHSYILVLIVYLQILNEINYILIKVFM